MDSQQGQQQQQHKRTVNIKRFKEWALCSLTPDCPINQVMQKEKDELTLEEAIAKTGMVCSLIDVSVDSKFLAPRTLEAS